MVAIAGAVIAGAAAAAAAVLVLASSSHDDDRSEGVTCAVAVASPAAPLQECAVCLSALAPRTAGCSGSAAAVRTLTGCGHGFHAECIGRWLPLRPECPLCRCPVVAEADADGQLATTAVVPWPQTEVEAAPAWSRPARIACGFGDGRVVWTRSPPERE